LVKRAKELGMEALALTDHDAMYAALDFYWAAKEKGIKPIIGLEIRISPRRMNQRDPKRDKNPHHLILLAKDKAGYQNLIKIATAAQLEGFYYKPRVDKAYLEEHAEGLIALSGCKSGEIPRLLLEGKYDEAFKSAAWYNEAFGDGNFYLEIQRHEGLPELEEVNKGLTTISEELSIPLVATNDVHYIMPEEAKAQEILLCIQTNTTILDPNRKKMGDESFYLKSQEEMASLFQDLPQALENSLRIAEMCELEFEFEGHRLPSFGVPDGYDESSFLRRLCEDGLAQRYALITHDIKARMEHELDTIRRMGLDTYFLIVWDLVRFAKERGMLVGPGRGSAAGSIVSYCLGITDLDPISHGLIFERFLNPERVTFPDIDLDFPDDRRDEVIRYVVDKYGRDRVSQIITFGTMGARAAIRDAGRALDLPLGEVDKVAKLIPFGPRVRIKDALEQVRELRRMYEEMDYIHKLIETAMSLEGVARHASTHAAGVVIADKPLINYTPLHRPTKEGGGIVTQYPMEVLEGIGLLKIDLLGLSTLTIIRKALDNIEETRGKRLSPRKIPLDDPSIYELLSTGEVDGVFQVEGPGFRRVLKSLKPSCFDDVVTVLALYRPGPMQFIEEYIARKHGLKKPVYVHPTLEPILKETYGICVFQEQIIRILTDLAGYSAAEADLVRHAVGKKKEKELLKHRTTFVEGAMRKSGLDREAASGIFDAIEYFSNYGFNKAHASAYAVLTCQTAYLKAKYPVEYMAALLSVDRGDVERVGALVAECRRLGINILPPDVNRSGLDFTIEGKEAIRFGMGAVKNVGEGQVRAILEARREGGDFKSVDDFCQRVDLRRVGRRGLECLIKVGAFEEFGRRSQLLEVVGSMIALSQTMHRAMEVGQLSMFGGDFSSIILPDVPEVPRKTMLKWEKELVGLYISEHPLQRVLANLKETITAFCGQIDESLQGQKVVIAGMVTHVSPVTTKRGKPMAFAQLEDLHGSIEVVVFPKVYEETRELWKEEKILLIKGEVDVRGREPKVICESVRDYIIVRKPYPLPGSNLNQVKNAAGITNRNRDRSETRDTGDRPLAHSSLEIKEKRHLHITIPRTGDQEEDVRLLGRVYELLRSYQGEDRFSFYVAEMNGGRVQLDFPNATTGYCLELEERLAEMLGEGAIRVSFEARPSSI